MVYKYHTSLSTEKPYLQMYVRSLIHFYKSMTAETIHNCGNNNAFRRIMNAMCPKGGIQKNGSHFCLMWLYIGLCYTLSKTQDAELGMFDASMGCPESKNSL